MGPNKRFANLLDPTADALSAIDIMAQYSEKRRPWVSLMLKNLRPMLYHINDPKFTVPGWRISGLDDGNGNADPAIILSAWPGYSRSGASVRKKIWAASPALTEYCDKHGRISNEEMTRLGLPDILPADKIRRSRAQQPFDDRPVQQDWCVILNHAAIIQRETGRKRAREEETKAVEERKRQRLMKIAADDAARVPVKKVRHANAACANLSCQSLYPGSGKAGKQWAFCCKRKCTALFCAADACVLARKSHEGACARN